MVGFFRSVTAASSTLPAAIAAAAAAALYSSNSSAPAPPSFYLPFPASLRYASTSRSFSSSRTPAPPTAAVRMDSTAAATEIKPPEQQNSRVLPELMTEFMVDMKCEGCVSAVKDNLQKLDGINGVDVDLSNQVVRVLGYLPVKTMLDALEQTGRKARLIGQGNPDDFLVSAAVAEFKGPDLFGVVRLAQVSMELARIEANFSGLSPGKHGWSINEFGDLTEGAASTGKIFHPANLVSDKPLGDLGTLEANEKGEAQYSGMKEKIKVVDLLGRSVAVYQNEDKSDPGISAAVIARSAGVGENYKKLCTCDGVTIWESS